MTKMQTCEYGGDVWKKLHAEGWRTQCVIMGMATMVLKVLKLSTPTTAKGV